MKRRKLGISIVLFAVIAAAVALVYRPSASIDLSRIGDSEYGGEEEGEVVQILTRRIEGVEMSAGPPYPSFERYSLDRGVREILRVYGRAPPLPTWLPEGMMYSEVYMGPVAIICFSAGKVSDFRFANVTIQVAWDPHLETLDDLRRAEESWKQQGWDDLKLVQIGETWVVMHERASLGDPEAEAMFGRSPVAWFWKDGFYCVVCVKSPLTPQDLTNIIEAMEPVG